MTSLHTDLVQRLATVLEGEERLYLELRDLLQLERVRIANLDGDGLDDLVREKETLVEEARLLEESRVELARALATALGFEAGTPALGELCDRLGPEGLTLREAQGRLAALVAAVRELLDLNAAYAGDSLQHVRDTLQLLGRLAPGAPTYGPASGAPDATAGRLVRRSA